MPLPPVQDRSDDEPVPLFGTWGRAYGAVVACAVLCMVLLYLFQGWPF